MLEIKPNLESKKYRFDAFLNSNLLKNTKVVETENWLSLHVYSNEDVINLIGCKLDQLITPLEIIILPKKHLKFDEELENLKSIGVNFVSLFLPDTKDKSDLDICFGLRIKPLIWREKFNFVDYCNTFITLSEIEKNLNFTVKRSGQGIKVIVHNNFENKTLINLIYEGTNKLVILHKQVVDLLSNQGKITTLFNFPNEIKTQCEQYLIYFASFLEDLGINATSSINEKAGKVLFSITPDDDIEALDKIRKALAVYLNLPSSPIVYDESFAAMRLQQQIENLQHSQRMAEREIRSSERELRLTQTVIEHQDKIIVQKDTIIVQQDKVIEKITSKLIMIDSLENKEEFEKVFDGLEFGESKELKEKLGIKFNPVTSLKSLSKKLTGSDDGITSLNLILEVGNQEIIKK